jgi:hypothetical protein
MPAIDQPSRWPQGGRFNQRGSFMVMDHKSELGSLSSLVRPALGVSFQKRGRDRKDFAKGAPEAAGGSPPNVPDLKPMVIL